MPKIDGLGIEREYSGWGENPPSSRNRSLVTQVHQSQFHKHIWNKFFSQAAIDAVDPRVVRLQEQGVPVLGTQDETADTIYGVQQNFPLHDTLK